MGDFGFGYLVRLLQVLAVVCLFTLPLAFWKLGEIVWWLVQHVRVTW